MATRFYTSQIISPEPHFKSAEWELFPTNWEETRLRRMFPWRSAFATQTFTQTETSAIDAQDALLQQFISPPLQAQTITGTVAAAFMVRETSSAANMRSQFIAYVVAPDGTVRGTLVPASTAGISNEWLASTTQFRSSLFPVGSTGTAVNSVAALAGDRIVVEVGYRAHNTTTTSYTGSMIVGGGANADVPQNETTTTPLNAHSWIEFSQDLLFEAYDSFSDTIAGASDMLPGVGEERLIHTSAFDTFTAEADDPTEIETFVGIADPPTAWVRMDGMAGAGAIVLVYWGAGYGVTPDIWVYDEVPTATSVAIEHKEYTNGQPLHVPIPPGETRYIAVNPGYDPSDGIWIDTNVFVLLKRLDAGPVAGEIEDDIASAIDRFPSAMGTQVDSYQANWTGFTTEADDPTEISTLTGNPLGYTGWIKLVVPSESLVTISVIEPTEIPDLTFWLYDEVPTAASVRIHLSDDDDPLHAQWPYLPEITLPAGTYYLAIVPYDGGNWPWGDYWEQGGQVWVRVRWESPPVIDSFDLEATLLKAWAPPNEPIMPTLVGTATTATVDSDSTLTVTVPSGVQHNDLLVVAISRERNFAVSPSMGVDENGHDDTNRVLNASINSHWLSVYTIRYQEDGGGTLSFTNYNSTTGAPFPLAMAGAVTAWRNASSLELLTFTTDSTLGMGVKPTNQVNLLPSEANYGYTAQHLAIWAGAEAGPAYWKYISGNGPVATEAFEATASSLASLVGYEWLEPRVTAIDQQLVIPYNDPGLTSLRNEVNLNGLFWIHGRGTRFGLNARLVPGFFLNAFVQEAVRTTHPREGPHTGTHPSTAIVTSAMLGSLPAGTDLNTVIADLDQRLTDLENQA